MANKEIPFYNVDQAVGPGAPNRRTDVMLVQYLLKEIYRHPSLAAKKPPGEMRVDGIFGPLTAQWILTFQEHARSAGCSIHVDGRVDPGKQNQKSSITRSTYTIQHMNWTYRRRYKEQHNHMERAPGVPGALAVDLAKGDCH